jgi:hypothetical protein
MSFSVASRMFLPRQTPALLIRTVGSPTSLRIWVAIVERVEGEVMSHL